MTPQRIVLGAWMAMIALATMRAVAGPQKGFPAPSIYLGSAVLFTALYGAASFAGPLAAAIAVGVDVGALLTPYLKGSQVGPINQLAGLLDQVAGATPSSGSSAGAGTFAANQNPPGTMTA